MIAQIVELYSPRHASDGAEPLPRHGSKLPLRRAVSVRGWLAVGVLLWSSVTPCLADSPKPATPSNADRTVTAAPVSAPAVHGRLETIRGIRVLKVWGTPYEQGYAHGHLLAEDILKIFDHVILNSRLVTDPRQYELALRGGALKAFAFDADREDELRGMLDGMTAKLGAEKLKLAGVKRSLDVLDLKAINTVADWYRVMCSSFSVWGERAAGGGMITARNLDFPRMPGLLDSQMVLVFLGDAETKRRGWVSVGWPGLIGAYTAINEEGVTVSMHDAPGGKPSAGPYVPRSVALRAVMERVSAADAVAQAEKVLADRTAFGGNNIHVSAPFTGQAEPAAVYEYDGDEGQSAGITRRPPPVEPLLNCSMQCTNHYTSRGEPMQCWRDDTIRKRLEAKATAKELLTPEAAREIIREVSVDMTLHTVIFLPNAREIRVAFCTPTRHAGEVDVITLKLDELLAR